MTAYIVAFCVECESMQVPFYAPDKAGKWISAHVLTTGHTITVRRMFRDIDH